MDFIGLEAEAEVVGGVSMEQGVKVGAEQALKARTELDLEAVELLVAATQEAGEGMGLFC